MKKFEIYKFKIDAYTPDTLPMARCAEYLTELSKILGETSHVHFMRVTAGSTQLAHKIEREAIPKVKERIATIKGGTGTYNEMKAYRSINKMLQEDNGTGDLVKGKSKILHFPGKKEEALKFTSIHQAGEIDGEVIRVGGSKDIVPIILSSEGNEITGFHAKRNIAKQLAKYLFEPVRLYGDGRWERNVSGEWSLVYFSVDRFDVLQESQLSQTVLALRGLKGEWKENALSELLESRHSEKDIN